MHPTSELSHWYASLAINDRRLMALTLETAISDLFQVVVSSSCECDPRCLDVFMDQMTDAVFRGIEASPNSDAVLSLIRALVTHNAVTPVAQVRALLHDMAEILFLPRMLRSEYQQMRTSLPPYLIHKILLEYALYSRHLDRLMDCLSKPFCRDSCPSPPLGCCHLLGYDLGLVPDRMLVVQALEATCRDWTMPSHPDLERCRYHTNRGCALRLFKTPACIGAMCHAVERDLNQRVGATSLSRFRVALSRFRNCDIDRKEVFEAMDDLLQKGQLLCR